MPKLRVLHCIYDDPGNPWVAGGGAVRVFEIYRRLAHRLASVTVATGSFPGARDEWKEGVHYHRLGAQKPYTISRLTYSAAASRLLARGEYDVAVYDFSTYTPLRLPRGASLGVTVHHITGETAVERWGRLGGRLVAAQERFRLTQARHFTATSRVTRDALRAMLGPDAEIRLVQAGVPDALFNLERREGEHLLYFGRLDWYQKGLDVLLEAMAILARERPGLRLRIAGRGRDLERVRSTARSLGIERSVDLLGAVDDQQRMRLLSDARLLLMPSRLEGFGMVAAEAMAAGVPVVGTTAGSLPEVVDPPRGGVLVPAGDAGALAEATRRLLDDDLARQAIGRTARESAERFRWDRIAEQHLEFLNSIHSQRRRAPSEP